MSSSPWFSSSSGASKQRPVRTLLTHIYGSPWYSGPVKTTVEIDDDELLKAAKRAAIDEGVTLRQLIEDGLRHRMALRRSSAPSDENMEEATRLLDELEQVFAEARRRLGRPRPYGTFAQRGDLYEPASKTMHDINQALREYKARKNAGTN